METNRFVLKASGLSKTRIEDPAGNNAGKSFEVDVSEKVDARLASAMTKVPFEVK